MPSSKSLNDFNLFTAYLESNNAVILKKKKICIKKESTFVSMKMAEVAR